LGITVTPVDPDDRVSVSISGVPSYESIVAPVGDTVTHHANTWTITESAAAAGTSLTGLTLASHYKGSSQPISQLTVTATNMTSGETARSSSQTLTVTDPRAGSTTAPGPAPGTGTHKHDLPTWTGDHLTVAPSGRSPGATEDMHTSWNLSGDGGGGTPALALLIQYAATHDGADHRSGQADSSMARALTSAESFLTKHEGRS
jgi:hypothetical protein